MTATEKYYVLRTDDTLIDINLSTLKPPSPKKTTTDPTTLECHPTTNPFKTYAQVLKPASSLSQDMSCFKYWKRVQPTVLPSWWNDKWAMGRLKGDQVPQVFYLQQILTGTYLQIQKGGAVNLTGNTGEATLCMLPDAWVAAVKAFPVGHAGSTQTDVDQYVAYIQALPPQTLLMFQASGITGTGRGGGQLIPHVMAVNLQYYLKFNLQITAPLQAVGTLGYGCGSYDAANNTYTLYKKKSDCKCFGLMNASAFDGPWYTPCNGGVLHAVPQPMDCTTNKSCDSGVCPKFSSPSDANAHARYPAPVYPRQMAYLDEVTVNCALPPVPPQPTAADPTIQVQARFRTYKRWFYIASVVVLGGLLLWVGYALWDYRAAADSTAPRRHTQRQKAR